MWHSEEWLGACFKLLVLVHFSVTVVCTLHTNICIQLCVCVYLPLSVRTVLSTVVLHTTVYGAEVACRMLQHAKAVPINFRKSFRHSSRFSLSLSISLMLTLTDTDTNT